MFAGERIHRLRELRRVSVSARCRDARARRRRRRHRGAHDRAALSPHLAGIGVRYGPRRGGDLHGRHRRAGRPLARRLRAGVSLKRSPAARYGVSGGFRQRAVRHALRLRGLRRRGAARGRGGAARADHSHRDRAVGIDRRGALRFAPDRGAGRRAMALAARCERGADHTVAIRRGPGRRAHVGPRRGGGRDAARARDRVRVALRQHARVLADLVCGGERRRVPARVRAAAPAQGDPPRRLARGRRAVARRQPVHARSSHRVLDRGHRLDPGRRADRRAGPGASSPRAGAVCDAALSVARHRGAGGLDDRVRQRRAGRQSHSVPAGWPAAASPTPSRPARAAGGRFSRPWC